MKITKDKLKEIVREELASLNEDQYGDVSFSRRKLKLAHEDAECILDCLANKAEDDELPNWWKDKVSKALDYLNVCRDYIKTNNVNDLGGVHENTEKEYPIWGIPIKEKIIRATIIHKSTFSFASKSYCKNSS